MQVIETDLPGVVLVDPLLFNDSRGHFLEIYHSRRYHDCGFPSEFVQQNMSFSTRGVLRGLHYQLGRPQGKLVMVLQGEIFDVAADIRKDSPTFGRWTGALLSAATYRQIYIPEGFAHGFCVTGETALVLYLCTDFYAPEEERGIRWDDPMLDIAWPIMNPILSGKDAEYPFLGDALHYNLHGCR